MFLFFLSTRRFRLFYHFLVNLCFKLNGSTILRYWALVLLLNKYLSNLLWACCGNEGVGRISLHFIFVLHSYGLLLILFLFISTEVRVLTAIFFILDDVKDHIFGKSTSNKACSCCICFIIHPRVLDLLKFGVLLLIICYFLEFFLYQFETLRLYQMVLHNSLTELWTNTL